MALPGSRHPLHNAHVHSCQAKKHTRALFARFCVKAQSVLFRTLFLKMLDYSARMPYNICEVINMERRMATVNFSLAGGTAGKGAKTCKITLPGSWLAALGVDEAHRQMELSFDGTQISLVPYLPFDRFPEAKKAWGHSLRRFRFYDGARLCSTIVADFTDQTLRVQNEAVPLEKQPSGRTVPPIGRIWSGSGRSAAFRASGQGCGNIWKPSA